jgi:hypothetical protein
VLAIVLVQWSAKTRERKKKKKKFLCGKKSVPRLDRLVGAKIRQNYFLYNLNNFMNGKKSSLSSLFEKIVSLRTLD